MSSLKRKIDVMKSPTSLIRFRNAVGVMLALSAIFAVVLSTISLPSGETSAQVTDPVAERAEAWWNALKGEGPTQPARANVLLGALAEGDTRDLGDPTRTIDATANPADPPFTPNEITQFDFDNQAFIDANHQTTITNFVDGDNPGDLYAVGDHLQGGTDNITALRGFQSVSVWWNHMDCEEMRTVVGEDNDDLNAGATPPETSAFCAMFDGLSSENQATVNKVGQAILGLEQAERSFTQRDTDRAEAWWNKLSAEEMVAALYGDQARTTRDSDDPNQEGDETNDDPTELAQSMYDDLDAGTTALVNDRWAWIYNTGVRGNDEGLAGVIYWWDSIECAERLIALGLDNEADANNANCASWDELNANNNDNAGQARQARVLEVGQAILGISPAAPDVACMVEHAPPAREDGLRRLRQPANEG